MLSRVVPLYSNSLLYSLYLALCDLLVGSLQPDRSFVLLLRLFCSCSSELRDLTRDCYGPCFCVTVTLDTLLSRSFAEIGHLTSL